MRSDTERPRLLYLVTEDWYFCSHRLSLALAAKDAGYDVSVATRVKNHRQAIESAGVRLIPFEMTRRGLNPLREFLTLARLTALYRREKPDILHHVALKPVFYGSLAGHIAGIDGIVNTIAGLGWLFTSSNNSRRIIQNIVRHVLSRALNGTETIVQNSDDFEFVRKIGQKSAHLILGSGVDTAAFRPQHNRPIVPCVVLASRMLWDKGVGEFVDAARILRQRGVRARFVLVGSPDPDNTASISESKLLEWHREGAVEYWGHRTDMADILANASIACLPSYYREGLPKSLLEAGACGLPIVTTDTPGCREAVIHGVNGLLVPPRNSEALAAALSALILDPELCQRMGAAGRVRISENFSSERINMQILSLYGALVERTNSARDVIS